MSCPLKDHRENGKVKRMIRKVNERLRTEKIVLERWNNGLSSILFALRSEIGKDGKSVFGRYKGHKPNTLKSAMVNGIVSKNDPKSIN